MARSTASQDGISTTPVVAIYNNLETFYPFLSHFEDPSILEKRKYRGDRALFWLGSNKLVITSSQIPAADRLCHLYGYTETRSLAPKKTTVQLSLDILNEPELVTQIVHHAGPGRAVQIVPYAATREVYRLAGFLQERCGLTVELPESPAEGNLGVRDFFDTKLGFRQVAPAWIDDSVRLPRGFAVQDPASIEQAVDWFLSRGLDCMVKPDRGESGLGIQFFDHRAPHSNLPAELRSNVFFRDGAVLVEEYIRPKAGLSPSLELFVPPAGRGEPFVSYLSNQHFEQLGRFNGVIISRDYLETPWYPLLVENGLRIAGQLQKRGYVGHFDLDTIIDEQEQVYLLEINTRRTGGTHAHEFARFTFSERYLDDVALFSTNHIDAAGVSSIDQLFDLLGPVLFPIASRQRGVVVTVSSTLRFGNFGCLIVGKDVADIADIKRRMEALLHPLAETAVA